MNGTALNLQASDQLELWQHVYQEICGVKPTFDDVVIPDDPGGFGWSIITTPEVPLNQFFADFRRKAPHWSFYGDDLEAALDWSEQERSYRDGAYGIRVRDVVEADEDLASLSANDIAKRGTKTITLDERVRLGGFYWVLSGGKHLDIENVTLCAGSRSAGGDVPRVDWRPLSREGPRRLGPPGLLERLPSGPGSGFLTLAPFPLTLRHAISRVANFLFFTLYYTNSSLRATLNRLIEFSSEPVPFTVTQYAPI